MTPFSWTKWLYYLYISGILIFGVNLLFQFIVLIIQCYNRPYVKDGPFRIIEISGNKAPCSFGNFIFINPSKYDWETYNQYTPARKNPLQPEAQFRYSAGGNCIGISMV
jgi:hypothetical protein